MGIRLVPLLALLSLSFTRSDATLEQTCNGKIVRRTIDFETDRQGNPTVAGDTPFLLPHGISVTGKRPRNDQPTENDLAYFDTANPSEVDKDLASNTEGRVIVISETNEKFPTALTDNRKGT